ncbi:MAG: CarD family transcriptional regulator [Myxococcota bacterium]
MKTYGVDELVVVPGCGVGRVEAVETMDVDGERVELYRIDLGESSGRMWVPTNLVDVQGVRKVMSPDSAEEAWSIITAMEAPEARQNWNRRQRRYNEKLMANQPMELAELLGELAAVRSTKELSFGERKIFERVRELLVSEIAAACGQTRGQVEERMTEVLA